MTLRSASRLSPSSVLVPALAVLALLATGASPAFAVTPADSIRAKDLVKPADLARILKGPAAQRPMLVHVGYDVLYRGGHVPGSVYAGPASRPEGVSALTKALQPVARTRPVVIYCGCCPWEHCPNVGPAFRAARKMGFRDVRVLQIPDDMQHDWVDKGYPVASGRP
jgi:thiosulfate/3-mercaptopyruvate sulfurtransferase